MNLREKETGTVFLCQKRSMEMFRFEHVDFAYDPKKPLIQDLNFVRVKAGQMVAVVGPTGAGKTTLINLLMRFYDVTHGAIKIDMSIDTKAMSRGSDVRSMFGMVLQRCLVVRRNDCRQHSFW